jgi:putative NIF3 family GTP cyclohydrolase 1 type 2
MAGTAGAMTSCLDGAGGPTAEALVRRIQAELGGEWPPAGPDGFKAGDPSTVVKGIATTAMATMDVLKQAVKANTNLVLTYEPTFYSRADGRAPAAAAAGRGPGGLSADDPVAKAKREFIGKNGLVVFRLRDHWQSRKENEMVTGLASALGWSAHRVKNDDALCEIPKAAAESTVALIRGKLNLRAGLRAVGDRKATIRRVLLFPGSMTPATMWQRYSEVDLIVAGEVREWENTHYAADMFAAGEKRALVTTGRVASEEPGMRMCAEWLKTVVKEVPAKWIGAGDPYWRPAA